MQGSPNLQPDDLDASKAAMEGFESGKEATDLRRWKLKVDEGRQVWHYIDGDEPVQQSLTDKYALGLLSVQPPPLN